jgi:hypothetical protein
MEKVAQKYKGKAEFIFVYCREAHPEGQRQPAGRTQTGKGIKQADTIQDRKTTAEKFCDDMKMSRRILVDDFGDQSAQRKYGNLNNPTVVIDVNGKVALKMAWTNGQALDKFLEPFLKNGGTVNVELANSVPLQGPGGRPAPNRPAGVSAPGPQMTTRMVDRILDELELTGDEAKRARPLVQAKVEARGRLRTRAMALDELIRSKKFTDAELAHAVAVFEVEISDYRKSAEQIDKELSEKLSPRIRARLLTLGVLETGIGFNFGGPGPAGRP